MGQEVMKLNVEGMACQHCVMSIQKAVSALKGVHHVDVNLKGKQVTVDYDPSQVDFMAIKNAIENQGYDVQ
jgi:copper chaperone